MSKVKDILDTLLEEKKIKFKNGFYQYSQCNFAYNSNKIEGNQLNEEQVTNLYENRVISSSKDRDIIKVDDVLEMINHFRLFDYMLDHVYEKVDEDMILTYHKILKSGTSDESNPIYDVGGFKTKPNIIGTVNVIQTSDPEDVESDIDALLKYYYSKETIQIEDIIEFHKKFETIHPLSDGNGRVGRMIMFKECIAYDIVPFVILNKDREFYLRGLREWNKERGYLIDTCLNEQDIYENICEQLHVSWLNGRYKSTYRSTLVKEIEEALKRGCEGKIITSTYQNFTDIESLRTFLKLSKNYKNFECHLDYDSFQDKRNYSTLGFHTKGYLFEFEEHCEVIVGSSNITRFAVER